MKLIKGNKTTEIEKLKARIIELEKELKEQEAIKVVISQSGLTVGILLKRFKQIHNAALPVYLILCGHAEEKTRITQVSISTIRKKTGYSYATVLEALKRLREEKIIKTYNSFGEGKIGTYLL